MHQSRRYLSALLSCLLVTSCSFQAQAQTADDNTPPKQTVEEKRQKRMRKFAESHEVVVVGSNEEVKLHETPIFSWANPQRQAIGGALYMWTLQGRPIATIGLWTYADIKDSYEYQSLHEGALNVSCDSAQSWNPRTHGISFQPIPNSVPPGRTTPVRLIQMRRIARDRFSSVLQQDTELRLLPQPIYRYDELPPDVIEGAVFSFALGTDPECLLIVEARVINEKPQWHYAFGSQTSYRVEASLDGKSVWSNRDRGDSFRIHNFSGQ
jgi:hypothetical protein